MCVRVRACVRVYVCARVYVPVFTCEYVCVCVSVWVLVCRYVGGGIPGGGRVCVCWFWFSVLERLFAVRVRP